MRRIAICIITCITLQAHIKGETNHSSQVISLTSKRSLHLFRLYLQLTISHCDNESQHFGVSQKAILCILLSLFLADALEPPIPPILCDIVLSQYIHLFRDEAKPQPSQCYLTMQIFLSVLQI